MQRAEGVAKRGQRTLGARCVGYVSLGEVGIAAEFRRQRSTGVLVQVYKQHRGAARHQTARRARAPSPEPPPVTTNPLR